MIFLLHEQISGIKKKKKKKIPLMLIQEPTKESHG